MITQDIELVRIALNAADDEIAWDAFNRILVEVDKSKDDCIKLRAELEYCKNKLKAQTIEG